MKRLRPHMPRCALVAVLLATGATAGARMDLTTLPNKDRSELTIYNSQDLTLGRETRTLSFRKGTNQIQFSWANTQIDPTSLQLDLKGTKGLTLLDSSYPKGTNEVIVWTIEAEAETSAAVEITYFVCGLTWSSNYVLVANKDETTFDARQFTRVTNNSGEDFEKAHVRVVVGDVNLVQRLADIIAEWNARFPSVASGGSAIGSALLGKRDLGLLQDEAKASRDKNANFRKANEAYSLELSEAKQIFKQAVSEYRVFAVEGEEDLQNGWSKALPNPQLSQIPFDLSYELDSRRYGPQVLKFYKLQNDAKHKLGTEVFPEGNYYVYRADDRGGNAFEGTAWHKYVPQGEKIELNLGNDGLVVVEDRELARQRSAFAFDPDGNRIGWDETVTRQFDVKNSRERAVPFRFTYYPGGNDFRVADGNDARFLPPEQNRVADVTASEPTHTQVDRQTVRWELTLPAQSTTPIKLTYVLHYGTNAKAN